MKAIDVGSVCVKTAGREAGEKAVVVEMSGENFVVIEGPKVKKRKCNISHLFPTGKKIEVSGLSKEELKKKIEV